MKNDDVYHSRYVVTDPMMLFNTLIFIGLTGMIIYEFIAGSSGRVILPLFIMLALSARWAYTPFNSYRAILLFNNKLQVSGLLSNTFSEIYYDTIDHIGFLKMDVSRSFIYSSIAGTSERREKLVLLLKDNGKITLPEPSIEEMNEILSFIKAKMEIGNFAPHGANTISSDSGFSGDYSQTRFQTGKTGVYVNAIVVFVFSVIILFSAVKGIYGACIFLGIISIPFLKIGYSYYQDFKEFMVYDDRLEIIDISGNIINTIYFSDIKNVGFLHSGTYVYNRFDSEGERTEEMILIMNNGAREAITEDISNLHQLCGIIQGKIGDVQ